MPTSPPPFAGGASDLLRPHKGGGILSYDHSPDCSRLQFRLRRLLRSREGSGIRQRNGSVKSAWTRLALADLDNAHDYIAEENPAAAGRVIGRIKKTVDALRRHPEIGRPGRVDGTRELIVSGTPFTVAYRVKDKRLEVLAVIHGARRWPDVM